MNLLGKKFQPTKFDYVTRVCIFYVDGDCCNAKSIPGILAVVNVKAVCKIGTIFQVSYTR